MEDLYPKTAESLKHRHLVVLDLENMLYLVYFKRNQILIKLIQGTFINL